jgi:hypothetical protein
MNEKIMELIKCRNSFQYFVNEYCFLTDTNKLKINLDNVQVKTISSFIEEKTFSYNKPIKKNISTVLCLFLLWFCLFKKSVVVEVNFNNDKSYELFLDSLKNVFSNLPKHIAGEIIKSNYTGIIFSTKSEIRKVKNKTKKATIYISNSGTTLKGEFCQKYSLK